MIKKIHIGLAASLMLFVTLMPIANAVETITKSFEVNRFQADVMLRSIITQYATNRVLEPELRIDFATALEQSNILFEFDILKRVPTYEEIIVIKQLMNSMAKASGDEEPARLIRALGAISKNSASIEAAEAFAKDAHRTIDGSNPFEMAVGGLNSLLEDWDITDDPSLQAVFKQRGYFSAASDVSPTKLFFESLVESEAAATAEAAAEEAAAAAAAAAASIQSTVDATIQENINNQTNRDILQTTGDVQNSTSW